jgi:hypothetical protein
MVEGDSGQSAHDPSLGRGKVEDLVHDPIIIVSAVKQINFFIVFILGISVMPTQNYRRSDLVPNWFSNTVFK